MVDVSKSKKIEALCAGKAIRIFGARPDSDTVSFVESFRNCGNKACKQCRDKSKRPHGPYWTLNYTDGAGRSRSFYVGRKLPEFVNSHMKVSFADVVGFYKQSEQHREALQRKQEEIMRMKKEIEALYEDLRIFRKQGRRAGTAAGSAGAVDRFFRQLVLKYHPDRNSHLTFDAEDVMKDINQLYQKLVKY